MSFCLAKRTGRQVARVSVMTVRVDRAVQMLIAIRSFQCTQTHPDLIDHNPHHLHTARVCGRFRQTASCPLGATWWCTYAWVQGSRASVHAASHMAKWISGNTHRTCSMQSSCNLITTPPTQAHPDHPVSISHPDHPVISTDPKLIIVTFARADAATGARPLTPGV